MRQRVRIVAPNRAANVSERHRISFKSENNLARENINIESKANVVTLAYARGSVAELASSNARPCFLWVKQSMICLLDCRARNDGFTQ